MLGEKNAHASHFHLGAILRFDREFLSPPIRGLELGPLEPLVWAAGNTFTRPSTVVPLFIVGALCCGDRLLFTPAALSRVSFALCGLVATQIASFTLKTTMGRQRPKLDPCVRRRFDIRQHIGAKGETASFPSGDASAASAFAALLAVLTGSRLPLFLCPAVSFARVYFHCHWVLDTVAGSCLGSGMLFSLAAVTPGGWRSFGAWHIVAFAVGYVVFMLRVAGGLGSKGVV